MRRKRYQYEPLPSEKLQTLKSVNPDDLIVSIKYYVDEDFAHIKIKDPKTCQQCEHHPCLYFCPAGVFRQDNHGNIMVGYQACVECGSCRIACPFLNIDWHLPVGGYGVAYKFG